MFQCGDFCHQESDSRYGAYPFIHCSHSIICDTVADDNASLRSCIVRHTGPVHSTDCCNCIVLGRAEAFAAKNNPVASLFDGLGMGLGFTIALTLLGAVREFLGTGKIFNLSILPEEYGMLVFVLAPGAFIALGYLIALINSMKKN